MRQAVARHPATPPGTLALLAADADLGVVLEVARHPSTQREILLKLAADPRDLGIRRAAQVSLAPLLRSEIREDVLERWGAP